MVATQDPPIVVLVPTIGNSSVASKTAMSLITARVISNQMHKIYYTVETIIVPEQVQTGTMAQKGKQYFPLAIDVTGSLQQRGEL